jgi:OOP family OmpA-OmpF porin
MDMNSKASFWATGAVLSVAMMAPAIAAADSGFYLGVGAGGATLEANLGDTGIPGLPASIDEDDTAVKVFAGYYFDLPVVTLGVEGAYTDFGEPEIDVNLGQVTLETTGLAVWGTAAFGLGPVDVYGKAGFLSWDAEASLLGESASEDGTDPGYGVGVRFNISKIEVRGEYEMFDLDDADLSMLSLGVAFRF